MYQSDFENTDTWLTYNKLILNTDKPALIIFEYKTETSIVCVSIDVFMFFPRVFCKYLGILMDNNSSFSNQIA